MSDWEIEPWRTPLRILLRHYLWKAVVELAKKSSVLENELVLLMQDEEEKVRENAIIVMSYLETRKKYYSQIKDALNDSSPRVRAAAARRIIHVNGMKSRALILELLNKEQDDGVIKAILESLKDVGEL